MTDLGTKRQGASGLIIDRRGLMAGAAALGFGLDMRTALAEETPKKGGTLQARHGRRQRLRQPRSPHLCRFHHDLLRLANLERPRRGRSPRAMPSASSPRAGKPSPARRPGSSTSARALPSPRARRWTPMTSSIRSTCIAARRNRARRTFSADHGHQEAHAQTRSRSRCRAATPISLMRSRTITC